MYVCICQSSILQPLPEKIIWGENNMETGTRQPQPGKNRHFNVSSLHELFDTVNAQNIFGFIRDIGLYRLL